MPRCEAWTAGERAILSRLRTPETLQRFIDDIAYNAGEGCRSPRWVMRDRRAHCMEGALFAAASLRFHGLGCRVLDMLAVRDDDHVIALYRRHGCWGAVAKSNFSGLRFREPVYRTLRELVMSYFEPYFNELGEKTLRSYSVPVDLARFDAMGWMTTDRDLEPIGDFLTAARHIRILKPAMIRSLRKVDRRSYEAGMVGLDRRGLFRVKGAPGGTGKTRS